MADAAKKRFSVIPASPAPGSTTVPDPKASAPKRPGLPSRQSTLSVTIQQRLREMQMVHEMLSAAMAEDDDANDEDKEEAARQADKGIAMLKAKLKKAEADEAENGEPSTESQKDAEANQPDTEMQREDPGVRKDVSGKMADGTGNAELRAQLEDSEAKVRLVISCGDALTWIQLIMTRMRY